MIDMERSSCAVMVQPSNLLNPAMEGAFGQLEQLDGISLRTTMICRSVWVNTIGRRILVWTGNWFMTSASRRPLAKRRRLHNLSCMEEIQRCHCTALIHIDIFTVDSVSAYIIFNSSPVSSDLLPLSHHFSRCPDLKWPTLDLRVDLSVQD